jgi:antagonist of KipI
MKINKAGMATVQDTGRFGYRNWGINNSGCMDESSVWLCNMLVANGHSDAVVEITGGEFSFTATQVLLLACGGKGYRISRNDNSVEPWQPFIAEAGDTVHIRPDTGGVYYVAVHGGVRSQWILNSRSTHLQAGFGGHDGRTLKPGDHLTVSVLRNELGERIYRHLSKPNGTGHLRLSPQAIPDHTKSVIRYFPANEHLTFSREALAILETEKFELTKYANRMGFRLNGLPMYQDNPFQMTSTAVVPGTMQVTPDGQMAVLMTDAQTTGGYPRIGQVCRVDLSLLAQQLPGSLISFRKITEEKAESIFLSRQQAFISLEKDYALFFS